MNQLEWEEVVPAYAKVLGWKAVGPFEKLRENVLVSPGCFYNKQPLSLNGLICFLKKCFSFDSQSNVCQRAHLHMVTQGSSSFLPFTLQKIRDGGLCTDVACITSALTCWPSAHSRAPPHQPAECQEEEWETEVGEFWQPLPQGGGLGQKSPWQSWSGPGSVVLEQKIRLEHRSRKL